VPEPATPAERTQLQRMTAEVREINTALGWRSDHTTFGEYIALLHSELSEALEAYRDWRLEDATEPRTYLPGGRPGPLTKPEGVGSEFADVLVRLLDTCDVYGIDLANEFWRKVAYNRTREFQHGGRTLSGVKEVRNA
jgi:NTP pyrophosphatase (non-canonical NTP hydrolase)